MSQKWPTSIFPDNINVQLKEKIMRIKKMITKENAFISSISHCLFIKEMYEDQSWELMSGY